MSNIFLISGAFFSMMAVAIGAFGAHALRSTLLANQRTEVFETAVRYHFYHSFALLCLGICNILFAESKWFLYAGYLFILGIFVFSGSLYVLSISNGSKWGAVTPIGGVFFIAGWICCIVGFIKTPIR